MAVVTHYMSLSSIQQLYVKIMKKAIPKKLTKELISAFEASSNGSSVKVKASTLANAVQNIAVRKVLNKALKRRKESVGNFLACVRKVTDLKISIDDFGGCCHTASSEPYFYDQSYVNGKTQKATIYIDDQGKHVVEREIWVREPRNTPIPVDEQGRCVLAQEMGERHPKTHRPPKWKCTSECKLPTKEERQRIVDLKSMFDSVRTLRRALDAVDSGCQNGHYTCSAPGRDLGDEPMIRDLAGHPLMCTITGCESKLSTLREAAPHYPMLRSFLKTLYEAIL